MDDHDARFLAGLAAAALPMRATRRLLLEAVGARFPSMTPDQQRTMAFHAWRLRTRYGPGAGDRIQPFEFSGEDIVDLRLLNQSTAGAAGATPPPVEPKPGTVTTDFSGDPDHYDPHNYPFDDGLQYA